MCNLADQWELEKNENIQQTNLWRLEAYYCLKESYVNFNKYSAGRHQLQHNHMYR
jgi:hypothetical protein